MDREAELLYRERSLAMLAPGAPALDREEAMAVLRELRASHARLRRLLADLARLVEGAGD